MSELNNVISEKIKIAMIKDKNMKLSELAKQLNTSAPNLSNKFKRNNINESDLRNIADALGYDVEINLINRENGEKI